MLSKIIRERIEKKFGQEIRYSKDCEVLADEISMVTSIKISASTIKRLFGHAKEPRMYTMDVLAIYLGYKNYDELLLELKSVMIPDQETLEEVVSEKLSLHDELSLFFEPNIKIRLNYLGNSKFEISEVLHPKLKEKDVVMVNHILRDYPLFINNVIRMGKSLGPQVAAKISGVTEIRLVSMDNSSINPKKRELI